ncbi:thiol:disulfide interchange protein DsbA/DsbL [Denitromonas iodatirespirans]|uniref:Thiol:disulfide interchange protein n=1 Tax=Denitromonas iodatirespirans TaxID=2795389 RepID=A0A944HA77_DENI1|nr:thiol:disulfide interchange protein DsbA/DsbL [Denitromonas iodatirespirans]MBT0963190.1 thiol:disulfide interchange protein DsbA/DsbL [Denitromonas iodatirespirans]
MNRRHLLLNMAALAGSAAIGTPVFAQGAKFAPVSPAQPTADKSKVEVIEFFHYGCPHCRDFDPLLEQWVHKLPADVAFVRVPAIWGNPQLKALAQLYYAAEATGDIEKIHADVFVAVQDEKAPLTTEEGVAAWVAGKGVDAKRFMDAYKSFGVQSKLQRADQVARAYRINGVPTLAIDGQWLTSASMAGSHEASLQVADELIAKARKAKGRG